MCAQCARARVRQLTVREYHCLPGAQGQLQASATDVQACEELMDHVRRVVVQGTTTSRLRRAAVGSLRVARATHCATLRDHALGRWRVTASSVCLLVTRDRVCRQLATELPPQRREDRITQENFPKPSKLLLGDTFLEESSGVSLALHFSLARADSGKVLAWGRGDAGQLGVVSADGTPPVESYE